MMIDTQETLVDGESSQPAAATTTVSTEPVKRGRDTMEDDDYDF